MKTVEYGIQPWSGKTMKARKNYPCDNCGGMIPKGTTYLRHVVRQGPNKGKDPLRNVHIHLDCQAPWHHAADDDRCRNLRQLPGRAPPPEERQERLARAPLAIKVDGEHGTLLWQLPPELAERMLHAPKEALQLGVTAELEQALELVLTALHSAAGNRRRGLKVSHALHELQLALE